MIYATEEHGRDSSTDNDDPVHRLVGAIVGSPDGNNNAHIIALANRVLCSQIGTNSSDHAQQGSTNTDLSSTWRRISRKARHPNAREEIEDLYRRYEKESSENGNPDLPPKVIATLTKLMGKRITMANKPVIPKTSTTLVVEKQIPMRLQSQQEQPVKVRTTENDFKRMTTPSMVGRIEASPIHQQPRDHSSTSQPQTQPLQSDMHANVPQVSKQSTPQNALQKEELQREEEKLLRECLYSLQGIDGERVRYYRRDPKDDSLPNASNYEGIRIQSPALSQNILYMGQVLETRLGSGAMDALKMCGEAGWLYTQIISYIHRVQHDRTKGVVARAFAETLAEQLRDYHSLLTTYETKLPGFTLRQMLVELRGPIFRLKTLAMLVDGMQELTGGRLLSALHKHCIHGNTVHVNIVQSILRKASRPWFEILYAWTTKGILSDPWNEFFVVENKDVEDIYLWNNRYSINPDQVPIGILDQEYVKPSFNVGKGINFIRRCLLDGQWTMQLQSGITCPTPSDTSNAENEIGERLGYRYVSNEYGKEDNVALKETLTAATGLVHSHILCALKEENHLMQHLFALKQFLLLGQGDFFSALMEGLHNEFNQSRAQFSGGVYKHSLLIIVDGALRSSNAKYLPQYIVERLHVEMILGPGEEMNDVFMGPAKLDRDDGLRDRRTIHDIFIFDYQVPDPVLSIVHTAAMDRYKIVFSLLFRLRKIEYMLNFTWRQSATLSHALQNSAQYTGIDTSSSTGYARATFLLRNISILRQSMTHLIVNLKSYLMFEVIEGGWQSLESAIHDASTLDEAIEAHNNYLARIIDRAMVRVSERDGLSQQNLLADQVDMVLKIINEFCDLQENLFDQSLEEAEITAQKRVQSESRLKQGQWGFGSQQDVAEQEGFFGLANSSVIKKVLKMSEDYNCHTMGLLRALSERVDGDPSNLTESDGFNWENEDLHPQQFLVPQLDHNNFYANQGAWQ